MMVVTKPQWNLHISLCLKYIHRIVTIVYGIYQSITTCKQSQEDKKKHVYNQMRVTL